MSTANTEIITIRPKGTTMTRQQLPNFVGISAATTGAKHLSMNMVVIPPGGAAQPHVHRGYETAIYLLSGRVERAMDRAYAIRSSMKPGILFSSLPMCPISPSI